MARLRSSRGGVARRSPWAAALYGGGNFALRSAQRMFNRWRYSGGKTRGDRSGEGSNISTFQQDSERLYTRKRPSRFRARRAKRWNKSVIKVINNTLADRNFRRESNLITSSTSGEQNAFSFSLNGVNGTVGSDDDLFTIATALGGSAVTTTSKFQLRNSILDLTVTSSGSNEAIVFLDFYYVYCRKDVPSVQGVSIANTWSVASSKLTGASSLTPLDYGATPFMTPRFCEQFIIQKVQRVQLLPGQTSSLMMKNTKLKLFNTEDITQSLFARKGMTRGIMCVYAGGPGATTGAPSAITLQVNCTRTYCINIDEDNTSTYATI